MNNDITELVGDYQLNQVKNMKNVKRFAVSSLITFVSVYAVAFCTAIQEPNFVFSKASLIALAASALIVGVRAVAKAVVEFLM